MNYEIRTMEEADYEEAKADGDADAISEYLSKHRADGTTAHLVEMKKLLKSLKADEASWAATQAGVSDDNIEASESLLNKYLTEHPDGQHRDEAIALLTKYQVGVPTAPAVVETTKNNVSENDDVTEDNDDDSSDSSNDTYLGIADNSSTSKKTTSTKTPTQTTTPTATTYQPTYQSDPQPVQQPTYQPEQTYQSEQTYQPSSPSDQVSFRFTGTINGRYPIMGNLTISGNGVTGRYCYTKTYKSRGDRPDTWINLVGSVSDGTAYLRGHYNTGNVRDEEWGGTMCVNGDAILFEGQYTDFRGQTYTMSFTSVR